MFCGNALMSEMYDRDSSTLPPDPTARVMGMSLNPLRNMFATLMTAERSLPSHSTLKVAMIESMLPDSTDFSIPPPLPRFENPTFHRYTLFPRRSHFRTAVPRDIPPQLTPAGPLAT